MDFTNCSIVPGRAYNGANGSKIAIYYDDSVYMLKFPPSGQKKPTNLSYTNSCFSEHIASSIFNIVGIKAQETMLGTYTVNGRRKIVCACKDFTEGGNRFFDFCSIKNTILDSESNGTGTELDEVLDTIEKQRFVSASLLLEHFWDMFIVDALLGNFDRHNGNWGFLYNDSTGIASIAPVFDCGSCLLPQADETVMGKVLSDEAELNARVFQFPTSALKKNDRKINYYDYLSAMENVDCNAALRRIVPRIDISEICCFIDSVPYISDTQNEFYKKYITARYDLILTPVYRRLSSN